ncbi:hypothetical protein L208DRAFT_399091 [Tricholoma matsutake]|nr:hypothetical protein L208DRAFT_399091 [Tricholoma matsutake 945]
MKCIHFKIPSDSMGRKRTPLQPLALSGPCCTVWTTNKLSKAPILILVWFGPPRSASVGSVAGFPDGTESGRSFARITLRSWQAIQTLSICNDKHNLLGHHKYVTADQYGRVYHTTLGYMGKMQITEWCSYSTGSWLLGAMEVAHSWLCWLFLSAICSCSIHMSHLIMILPTAFFNSPGPIVLRTTLISLCSRSVSHISTDSNRRIPSDPSPLKNQ